MPAPRAQDEQQLVRPVEPYRRGAKNPEAPPLQLAQRRIEARHRRAITRQCLMEQKSIMGEKPGAVVIEGNLPNIDTEIDLIWANFLIEKGLAS